MWIVPNSIPFAHSAFVHIKTHAWLQLHLHSPMLSALWGMFCKPLGWVLISGKWFGWCYNIYPQDFVPSSTQYTFFPACFPFFSPYLFYKHLRQPIFNPYMKSVLLSWKSRGSLVLFTLPFLPPSQWEASSNRGLVSQQRMWVILECEECMSHESDPEKKNTGNDFFGGIQTWRFTFKVYLLSIAYQQWMIIASAMDDLTQNYHPNYHHSKLFFFHPVLTCYFGYIPHLV